MSTIEERLQNVRTLEDIVNLLTILFTNLNNQNEQYYDMFLNPVPMDLDLERYDENGELVTVVHPNVAKMRISTYTGTGSPNGKVAARVGSLYIDLSEAGLYYKGIGDDSYGWVLVWSSNNFVNGEQYLRPDGDASHLQTINANSISSGVVKVQNGGTGTTTTYVYSRYITSCEGTATENVEVQPSKQGGKKILSEGQLLIEYNGVYYNILGQPMKP